MPPRPQPQPLRGGRKASSSAREPQSILQADKDAKAMPPPPVPKRILEPEMTALSTHLKNATVKTGLIYGFAADTRRLGIQKHAPRPPASLTAALGREIEKYDQLCDAMESHLLRAIAILERDLKREEQRVKEAEEAAKTSAMQIEPDAPELPPPTSVSITPSSSSPTSSIPGRRPSAISISSLHRPAFPLKLDLSSASLRLSPEEASTFGLPDGLHSPVTLAPKSARPQDFPQDLIEMAIASASATSAQPADASARVDIDLTLTEPSTDANMETSLGTADKPIELDLDSMDIDMSDLFGDDGDGSDIFNSPVIAQTQQLEGGKENFTSDDLFGIAQPQSQRAEAPTNQTTETLLATFTSASAEGTAGDAQFNLENIDYGGLFGNGADGFMDQFLGDINASAQQPPPKT